MVEREQPVAIITGAGRGIGRATALELASKGYRLVLAARSQPQLDQTLHLAGGGIAVPTDVAQPQQVDHLISTTLDRFGRIDALVHCAGVAPAATIEQMSIEQWHQVIDTNLSAAFYLSRAAWPTFRRQHGGVVVHVSSPASRDPFPGFAAYAAAKAGLNLFSLVLAREGQPIGVRVHTIAPGAVETEMFRALRTCEQWPPEKTLDPADVARVIAQCVCGDLRYTSGEVIFMAKSS